MLGNKAAIKEKSDSLTHRIPKTHLSDTNVDGLKVMQECKPSADA